MPAASRRNRIPAQALRAHSRALRVRRPPDRAAPRVGGLKVVANHGWASSPLGFVRRVFAGAYNDNIFFTASALTFQALVAALPFALLALAILGYFLHAGDDVVERSIARFFADVVPTAGAGEGDPFRSVERFLASVAESRGRLSIYGIPLFLWFSTRFFGGVRAALNGVFDTHESRPWWKGIGLDFFLVMATLVLIVLNAVITVRVIDWPWFGRLASNVSTLGIGVLLYLLIYKVAPTQRVRWDTAAVAAAVAALGFEVTKRLYVVYLMEFATLDRLISNTNAIALVLLVVWVYFLAVVFLMGAEVAETYDLLRRQKEQRAILT